MRFIRLIVFKMQQRPFFSIHRRLQLILLDTNFPSTGGRRILFGKINLYRMKGSALL